MNTECQLHKIYAWRRFWVRADTELLLEDDAYLPDPERDFSRFMNQGVGTLAEACDDPCSILLGEPGIGKSKSLEADFDKLVHIWAAAGDAGALIDIGAAASLTDLRTVLLANDNVRRWRDSGGIFHLCLDSLDEALPNYPGLPKALMSVIQELPKERVRLVIACRAGEFPLFLYESFEAHFGPSGVSRWYMAPLRQKDVHLAATENNLDGDAFMSAVREREAQPLAARPITLDLLLGEATSGSDLLPDIWRLYERGCRRMLSERPDSSRFIQAPTLELSQKMAVAGRIACVTIFGAFTTVEISPDVATHSGAVKPEDIAGGQEITAGASFPISSSEIHEVLKTGVFTASGLTFRWLHKSYGEFLAYHLRPNVVSKNQVISLISCAGRVAPALRGVTAWLTSKDEDVFRHVLKLDPEVLLFSDLSTATDHQRAELVDWLLREARANNPLVHEWGTFWTYRKLKHTGLRSQLEPIIQASPSDAERFCAIRIAEACSGAGLSTPLTDLALREGEPPYLRIAAASCVADHGDEVDKVRLLPVALQVSKNEAEERLKAQALSAVWPAHFTWTQIRDSLGADDPQTTTPLGRFLGFDFAEGLPPSDLPDALDWLADKNCYPDGLSGWAAATDQLLMRASAFADDPAVRRAMVGVLFARLSKHHKPFYESGTKKDDGIMPWSASTRRAIAVDLIPKLAPNAYLAISALRTSNPLLVQGDIEFMMDRWDIAATDEKLVWQAAITWTVDWRDPEASSTVLTMSVERYPGLQPILESHHRAVISHLERE
jgi:hypothetical protein